MIDTGSSFLAVSHIGDIVQFSCPANTLTSTVEKLWTSKDDTYRIDDFAWSDLKDTLIVGYLGAKEGRETVKPPSQVVLFKREQDTRVRSLYLTKLFDVADTVFLCSSAQGSSRPRSRRGLTRSAA
jgi:hypothetical protein